jgi:hypothetical protein
MQSLICVEEYLCGDVIGHSTHVKIQTWEFRQLLGTVYVEHPPLHPLHP